MPHVENKQMFIKDTPATSALELAGRRIAKIEGRHGNTVDAILMEPIYGWCYGIFTIPAADIEIRDEDLPPALSYENGEIVERGKQTSQDIII